MRILSLQTQYGEEATIYELVGPALSPMSRASPCDDHIVTKAILITCKIPG